MNVCACVCVCVCVCFEECLVFSLIIYGGNIPTSNLSDSNHRMCMKEIKCNN